MFKRWTKTLLFKNCFECKLKLKISFDKINITITNLYLAVTRSTAQFKHTVCLQTQNKSKSCHKTLFSSITNLLLPSQHKHASDRSGIPDSTEIKLLFHGLPRRPSESFLRALNTLTASNVSFSNWGRRSRNRLQTWHGDGFVGVVRGWFFRLTPSTVLELMLRVCKVSFSIRCARFLGLDYVILCTICTYNGTFTSEIHE